MAERLTTIGFDADDTLWQNEAFFQMTQARFAELLADYTDPDPLHARLLEAERRNLGHYGFGIKGFCTPVHVVDAISKRPAAPRRKASPRPMGPTG